MSSTAAAKMFGTAELLEAILLNVDMQTLLLSQRVNTTFRAAITGSPALQRALWFSPTPPTTRTANNFRRNPLISRHRSKLGIEAMYCDVKDKATKVFIDFKSRPVLRRTKTGDPCILLVINPRHGLIGQQEGSWKRMIPFQAAAVEESWLLGGDFEGLGVEQLRVYGPAKGGDGGTDRFEKEGGRITFPGLSMGRRSEAPTLGEIVDFIAKATIESGDGCPVCTAE